MEKEFIKLLEQSKVKTRKAIPKRKQKLRLSQETKRKLSEVKKKKHITDKLADIIEAKIASGWDDEDYDVGKDW